METQDKPQPDLGSRQAAEHVAGAQTLLKVLQDRIGEHPEIGQAVHKLEMASRSSRCRRVECFRWRFAKPGTTGVGARSTLGPKAEHPSNAER